MDPALKKLLEAVSIKGQSEENLDQCYDLVASKEIPFEDFLPFLRALAARVQSSKTFDVLSKLLNRGFYGFLTGMNLEEFSNLYPLEEGFLLNVLRLFTDRKYAISIHALNIYVTEGMAECTSPRKMELLVWTEFTKMKKLNNIYIEQYFFTLDDLMAMSRHLPVLRTLKVLIHSESQLAMEKAHTAIILRNTFPSLEEFLYSITQEQQKGAEVVPRFSFFEKFTNFFIKNLPKLKEVRCAHCLFDMTKGCEEMEETSQLENLQLNPLHLDLVAFNADKFPNVVSLTLDWRKILYGTQLSNLKWSSSLKQFPKLNDLKNFGLNSRVYLTYILDILGPNLRILHFEYGLKIDFKDIHQHCPNLEKLEIVGNSVDDSNSIEYFDSLHDLRIKFSSDSSKELNLTNLLAAPNIKTVKLSGFQVNKHEMKKTIVMIKNEQILTQVETLTLTLDGRMPAKTKRAIQSEYNRFFIAVQNGQQRDFSFKLDFTEDIQRC